MKDLVTLLTILVNGLFAAFVAWMTARYSIKRISHEDAIKWNRAHLESVEETYVKLVSCISKMLGNAVNLKGSQDLGFEELHSRVEIIGRDDVIAALHNWTDKFNEWLDAHVAGSPKKIGDGESNLVMLSSYRSPFREKAKALYPEVHEAGSALIGLCRKHLNDLYNERSKFS